MHSYLDPAGPSASFVAQAASSGQQVLPKSDVITILVQDRVFADALARTAGGAADRLRTQRRARPGGADAHRPAGHRREFNAQVATNARCRRASS